MKKKMFFKKNMQYFNIKIFERKNKNIKSYFLELFSKKDPFFYFSNKINLQKKNFKDNELYINSLIKKFNKSDEQYSKINLDFLLLKNDITKIKITEDFGIKKINCFDIDLKILPDFLRNKIMNSKYNNIKGKIKRQCKKR